MKKIFILILLFITLLNFSVFAEEEQNEYVNVDVTMSSSYNDFDNISAQINISAGYYWFLSVVEYVYKWNSGTGSWDLKVQDQYYEHWPYDGVWRTWATNTARELPDLYQYGNGTFRYKITADVNSASGEDYADFTVTDVTAPSTPTSISGYINAQNHPRVTWSDGNENDLNGFKIYRADGNEAPLDWYYLASVSGTANGYTDETITSGGSIGPMYVNYKVTSYDHNSNESSYSSSVQIQYTSPQSTEKKGFATQSMSLVPTNLELYDNFPNPFNPSTTIRFYNPKEQNISINVYAVTGELVANLYNGFTGTGSMEIQWNGLNNYNQTVSSGIYIYELVANDLRLTRKMLLAK